jgi:uncharacterized protein YjeT (DUF2065 family)
LLRQIAGWIAVILVLEGALYALFPEGMKRVLAAALEQPPEVLRMSGLVAAIAGVGLAWLARG